MASSDLKLISLFAVIVAILILRISVESTGYTTPDSIYYLEAAENLFNRKNFYPPSVVPGSPINSKISQIYFGYWPLGYPFLIAVVALMLPISIFWASKVVNFAFLGLCFLLFRKLNSERAYLLALTMCAFTFLEIYSYTWSEAPFLFGILWWGFTLFKFLKNSKSLSNIWVLFFATMFLFLIRYVGGIFVLLVGVLGGWFLLKKNYSAALKVFIAFAGLCLFICFYLYLNYRHTGYLTGGERLYPFEESTLTFFKYLLIGLFNEFFITKNYYFKGEPHFLFLILAAVQLFLLGKMCGKVYNVKLSGVNKNDDLSFIYIIIGLVYLLGLICLRRLSPFDEFDYRLLAPFSICLYVGLILYFIQPDRAEKLKPTGFYTYMVFLFGFSLLMNLPKNYLFTTFSGLFKAFLIR